MRRPLIPLLFLPALACLPDLPAGWEDARKVDALTQTDCDGSPYGDTDSPPETATGDLAARPVHLGIDAAHFRCAQDVEGYVRADGDTLHLLVQPVDMDPRAVAACDCLYDIDATIELTEAEGTPVEGVVWRRWDNLNDDNDPVRIGAVSGSD